jgi:hypothetical protein
VIPAPVADPANDLANAIERVAPGRLAGLYLVGGLALGDFSDRQSNIDLVVVCDPPLTAEERAQLAKAQRRLERAGRPPSVWYTGWDEIADGPVAGHGSSELDTPLTRALLREEAVAFLGPDWPVVAYDDRTYRAWCRSSVERLAADAHGLMVMRRGVSPLVLQAARLAQGAATGRVFSKSEAGETATSLVPVHFRRILNDAVGYRHGANTSMYWGPFERKYDALRLLRQLAAAVAGQ